MNYVIKDKISGVYFKNGDDVVTFISVERKDATVVSDSRIAHGFRRKAKRICESNNKSVNWVVVRLREDS